MKKCLMCLAFVGVAATARAQARVALPANDAVVSIGWFAADYQQLQEYDRWHQSFFSGVGGGHYWTAHLKTEVEGAWLSRVSSTSYEQTPLPAGPAIVRTTYRFQTAKVSLGQVYQLGENQWVHPYVGAGADVDIRRTVEERPEQNATPLSTGRSSATVVISRSIESDEEVRVRPFVKAGFKMYVAERTFFTTEWKAGFGTGVQNVVWKTGFGFDF